jgi:GT2 family glycosyltransferase
MLKFSLAIPTFNRPEDLKLCINSILDQSYLPHEVIIIDDGDLEDDFLRETNEKIKSSGIRFIYYKKDHKKERRGLSESKNIALEIAQNEIIFIIDDDVMLPPNAFMDIMKLWEENYDNPYLIGIGGVGLYYRKKTLLENFYNLIFCLTGNYAWDVNEFGFQVWDDYIKEIQKGYYMHGFFASFRRELAIKLGGFDTFMGGRTALEDVAFCLKAKNAGYFCLINPKVKIFHKKSKTSREKEYLIGFKESQNRKIIFRKYCKQDFYHKICFFWANLGWILRQFLVGHFSKGWGMLVGFIKKIEISQDNL